MVNFNNWPILPLAGANQKIACTPMMHTFGALFDFRTLWDQKRAFTVLILGITGVGITVAIAG